MSGFARRNLPHTLLHQLLEGGGEGQEEAGGAGGKEGKEQGRLAAAGGAGKTAGASGSGSGTGHGNASGSGSGSGSGFNSTGGGGRGGGAVQGALWRAVESLDAQLAVSGIDVVNSGTTAAMCHVHGRALTAAWVGDSRIVLGVPAAAPAAGVVAASGGAAAEHKTGSGGEGGGGSGGGLSSSLRGLGISSSSGDVVAAAAAEGGAAPAIKWGHPPAASPPDGGGSGGSGWRVVWQSTDHKPELPAEAARIEAAGGRVARSVGPQGPVGPFRVWFKKQVRGARGRARDGGGVGLIGEGLQSWSDCMLYRFSNHLCNPPPLLRLPSTTSLTSHECNSPPHPPPAHHPSPPASLIHLLRTTPAWP